MFSIFMILKITILIIFSKYNIKRIQYGLLALLNMLNNIESCKKVLNYLKDKLTYII